MGKGKKSKGKKRKSVKQSSISKFPLDEVPSSREIEAGELVESCPEKGSKGNAL